MQTTTTQARRMKNMKFQSVTTKPTIHRINEIYAYVIPTGSIRELCIATASKAGNITLLWKVRHLVTHVIAQFVTTATDMDNS